MVQLILSGKILMFYTIMKRLMLSLSAAITILGFSACGSSSSIPGSETEGNWVKKATLPGVGRSYAVTFTINGTAYVATGVGPSSTTRNLTDLWAYDAASDTWTPKASLSSGLGRRFATAFAVGGKGYVGTGFNYDTAQAGSSALGLLSDFYSYDPSSNSWSRIADFPGGPRQQAIGFALGNYGYVGTGKDKDGLVYSDIYKYDPSSNTWSTTPSNIPGDKRYGAVAFTYNDKAYIVTGANNSGQVTDFYSYDGDQGWTALSKIRNALTDQSYDDDYSDIARSDAAVFVIGEWAYLTTGAISGSATYKTWAYHITTDRWERRTPYKQSARVGAVGFAVGNYGYIVTGAAAAGSQTGSYDNVSLFDPSSSYVENDDAN